MMNDAMKATETMIRAAVAALGFGYKVDPMRPCRSWGDISILDPVSCGRIATITVYESGRFQELNYIGGRVMKVTPELEALRFRRAA